MIRCPECGAQFVGRARRQRLAELFLGLVTIYPFRCQLCSHRFLAFRGRPTYSPRREYRRLPARDPVSFRLVSASAGPAFHGDGVLIDLSIRGGGLESVTPIPEGIRLHLQLTPADSAEVIDIEDAVVRHARGTRVGVEFLALSSHDQGRLGRLVERRLAHQPFPTELN